MAETITPAVHGGRRRPYVVASALHVAGATVAATLLGLALGVLGTAAGAPWSVTPAVVTGVALLYFVREAAALPIPLPDRKRQVPEWWRTFYSPAVAALLYGAGLGVGFLTYLSFGTFVVVAAGAIASGEPATAGLLCGSFGLARGLAVVAATWRGTAVERLDELAQSRGPRAINAAALGVVAVAAAAATFVAP